jgi:MoxR-like ATPase
VDKTNQQTRITNEVTCPVGTEVVRYQGHIWTAEEHAAVNAAYAIRNIVNTQQRIADANAQAQRDKADAQAMEAIKYGAAKDLAHGDGKRTAQENCAKNLARGKKC